MWPLKRQASERPSRLNSGKKWNAQPPTRRTNDSRQHQHHRTISTPHRRSRPPPSTPPHKEVGTQCDPDIKCACFYKEWFGLTGIHVQICSKIGWRLNTSKATGNHCTQPIFVCCAAHARKIIKFISWVGIFWHFWKEERASIMPTSKPWWDWVARGPKLQKYLRVSQMRFS